MIDAKIKEIIDAFLIRGDPLTFDEALKYFGDKLPLSPDDFIQLSDKYKTAAFTVAGYTDVTMVKSFQDELYKAIENGSTMMAFRKEMNSFLDRNGYKGLTPFQTENIFRTNVQTAYSVGHYEQMTDPDVMQARPIWVYDAVNDKRTRPTHLAMDGMAFSADHEIWDTWYPPNGFRCRCTVRSLTKAQAAKRGIEVKTSIPEMASARSFGPSGERLEGPAIPLRPDANFRVNPAKHPYEPDTDKLPSSLKKAFDSEYGTRD